MPPSHAVIRFIKKTTTNKPFKILINSFIGNGFFYIFVPSQTFIFICLCKSTRGLLRCISVFCGFTPVTASLGWIPPLRSFRRKPSEFGASASIGSRLSVGMRGVFSCGVVAMTSTCSRAALRRFSGLLSLRWSSASRQIATAVTRKRET